MCYLKRGSGAQRFSCDRCYSGHRKEEFVILSRDTIRLESVLNLSLTL